MSAASAVRLTVAGGVAGLQSDVQSQAQVLGLHGWVRLVDADGTLHVHAEGPASALAGLAGWLQALGAV